MPLTLLDPVSALVVIDLQKGLADMPLVPPMRGVIAQAAGLARAFRGHGLPVVLVSADGVPPGRSEYAHGIRAFPADFAELVPELDRQPDDILIVKQAPGAFVAGLEAELRRRGVTQVVMCGVATSLGVEGTARQAYDLGFNVAFAVDAMADRTAESHAHSLETIFPRLGERGTSAEIIAKLDERRR